MIAVIKNSLWLMLEKVLFALAGIFISVYVARYLQPEKFGVITYLLAIVAITVPLIQLGADNVIFNRIARRESAGIRLMLMSAKLRGFLFIFTSIAILLWGGIYLPAEQKWMLVLVLVSSWFSIQDVYRIYYDATLHSKKNTFINNAGMMLSMLLRVVLVKASMGMAWFIIPYIVNSAVPYFIRRRMFKRSHPPTMTRKRWQKRQGRYNSYMFKVGLPLAISTLSIVIFTRIDQIMLGSMVGTHAVGLYGAAISLSQGWAFVPMALLTSLMPSIARQRTWDEQRNLIRLMYLVILACSLPVVLLLGYFAEPLVLMLFGSAYAESATIIPICAVTMLFALLGTLSYRVIVLFSGYRFIAIKMPLVALINIALNYLLIPKFGLKGAAISTLLAEFCSFFVLNMFFQKGKITALQLTCFQCIPLMTRRVISHVKKYS